MHLQSRARQEDPEQARLKQKAKEVRSPPDDPEVEKQNLIGFPESRRVADDAH